MIKTFKKPYSKDAIRLVLIIAGFYAIWIVVKFLNLYWMYRNDIPLFGRVINPMDRMDNMLLNYIIGVLMASIMVLIVKRQFRFKKVKWYFVIPFHLVLSFVFGVVIMAVIILLLYLNGTIPLKGKFFEVVKFNVLLYIDIHFLTYFSFLAIAFLYFYFKGLQSEITSKMQLKSALFEIRVKALNARLQPHFIFNVLNGVSSLMEEDKEKAQRLLSLFSDMLRGILKQEHSTMVTLEEELRNLRDYVEILSIRFQEDLKINFHIEEGLNAILVPNFFMQPLVENSVNHGFGIDTKKIVVNISIKKQDDLLVILVENNGQPLKKLKNKESNGGYGLQILQERLRIQYGDKYLFRISNKRGSDRGVENSIIIPIKQCKTDSAKHEELFNH